MGQTSRTLGQGTSFEFEGNTYTMSPWTYEIQGRFEQHLEDEATRVALRQGKLMAPEERADLLERVNSKIVAGKYTFGSDTVLEALQSPRHAAVLLLLCLQPNHPNVGLDIAKSMVKKDWEQVIARMNEANADPTKSAGKAEETTPAVPAEPT